MTDKAEKTDGAVIKQDQETDNRTGTKAEYKEYESGRVDVAVTPRAMTVVRRSPQKASGKKYFFTFAK